MAGGPPHAAIQVEPACKQYTCTNQSGSQARAGVTANRVVGYDNHRYFTSQKQCEGVWPGARIASGEGVHLSHMSYNTECSVGKNDICRV